MTPPTELADMLDEYDMVRRIKKPNFGNNQEKKQTNFDYVNDEPRILNSKFDESPENSDSCRNKYELFDK
ncbi:hypothetical protein TNIN_11571, partial [Trichonephila inaurata madagascariensis]